MKWIMGLMFLVAACVSRSPLPNVEVASSVHFESAVASCTAISIGKGSVLTAGHCISPFAATVEEYPANLKWYNRTADVALLHVPELEQAPFSELACRIPKIGEDVMMIADSDWKRDIHVFGKIASEAFTGPRNRTLILIDMRGGPGNSGAPVYDIKGRVVAMTIAVIPALGNIVAAIPSSMLCELIEGEGTLKEIEIEGN